MFLKDLESSDIKDELNERRSFGDSIFTVKITISEADKKQSNLLDVILNSNNKVRPRSKADKEKKSSAYKSANILYQGRELTLNTFKRNISIKINTEKRTSFGDRVRLKLLTPKLIL